MPVALLPNPIGRPEKLKMVEVTIPFLLLPTSIPMLDLPNLVALLLPADV